MTVAVQTIADEAPIERTLCHRHNSWYLSSCWRCHLEQHYNLGPLRLQFQPKQSRVCGQTCVAMVLGEDREQVVKHRFGHRHKTSGKQLRQVLEAAGKRCGPWRRAPGHRIPDVAFAIVGLRSSHADAPAHWKHWVVVAKGHVYDPSVGAAGLSHACDTLSYDEAKTYAVSFMEIG